MNGTVVFVLAIVAVAFTFDAPHFGIPVSTTHTIAYLVVHAVAR